MRDIILLGYAREGSTRVKNKMIRPFGDTTLFDIYAQKLSNISHTDNPFTRVMMAIGESDKTLWKKIHTYDLWIANRNDYSINASISNDCRHVYHYLEDCDEEYVMWVNGCFPFLKESTIVNAANYFITHENIEGLHCVKNVYNWIWNKETGCLYDYSNAHKISTVHFNPYLESVHCFHIYKRKHLLEKNSYWNFTRNDPFLYEIEDGVEFMDIDTEEEFKRCEYIYNMKYDRS